MNIYTSETEFLKTEVQRLRALVRAQQITIDKLEAQRTWVGLTDDEKETLSYKAEGNTWTAVELAEAKLKEKNT
jgi:hypothetical protein